MRMIRRRHASAFDTGFYGDCYLMASKLRVRFYLLAAHPVSYLYHALPCRSDLATDVSVGLGRTGEGCEKQRWLAAHWGKRLNGWTELHDIQKKSCRGTRFP